MKIYAEQMHLSCALHLFMELGSFGGAQFYTRNHAQAQMKKEKVNSEPKLF